MVNVSRSIAQGNDDMAINFGSLGFCVAGSNCGGVFAGETRKHTPTSSLYHAKFNFIKMG